ncbi:hypothetical protein GDO78_021122 [Eleutherodactylus coqui]|uniref:Uncharacterized protein n=1 Tax=Eleutherodactylus coqui TaxID=57060 RepID=A0A8J6EH58_ELECQ|nr:hypothetical protein GDO78_021122 [Eleutherodactylus coqui]
MVLIMVVSAIAGSSDPKSVRQLPAGCRGSSLWSNSGTSFAAIHMLICFTFYWRTSRTFLTNHPIYQEVKHISWHKSQQNRASPAIHTLKTLLLCRKVALSCQVQPRAAW